MMKCKEIHKQINPYLSGLLVQKELALFESHLEECISCNQLVREVSATLRSNDNPDRLPADPYLYTRLMQEIENRKEQRIYARILRVLQPIAAAAILIVGIYLGIGLGNSYLSNDSVVATTDSQTLVNDFLFNDVEYESIGFFLIDE